MTSDPELVRMLRRDARQRGLILTEHTADSSGRCPVCRGGGASSGRQVGPCRLWLAADRAWRELRADAPSARDTEG